MADLFICQTLFTKCLAKMIKFANFLVSYMVCNLKCALFYVCYISGLLSYLLGTVFTWTAFLSINWCVWNWWLYKKWQNTWEATIELSKAACYIVVAIMAMVFCARWAWLHIDCDTLASGLLNNCQNSNSQLYPTANNQMLHSLNRGV